MVENGFEAIDAALNGDFDLIFMDLQMPEMGGLEATQQIRQQYPKGSLPIVALTAKASAEDQAACREAGMDSHLEKPIHRKKLLAMLDTLATTRSLPQDQD